MDTESTLSSRLTEMAKKAMDAGRLQEAADLISAAAAVDTINYGADPEVKEQKAALEAAFLFDSDVPLNAISGCSCEYCMPQSLANMRMIVCAICGNKRCPHATHHGNPCTNSNEPGQEGSAWEHALPLGQ